MADSHVETVTVAGEGITVPLLVWRRFRRHMPGMVERVLDENPGLPDLGLYLPLGTVVRIPIPAAETDGTARVAERIQLW